jgi:NADP-dependent aldehyde dehydrogenase
MFLLPSALAQRAETIAEGFVDSLTLGVGQFCTKPGLVLGLAGPDFNRFSTAAQKFIETKSAAAMLNPGIHHAYCTGAARWSADTEIRALSAGSVAPQGSIAAQPQLFSTTAQHFLRSPHLLEEVFGPAALLIECASTDELLDAAHQLDGQLTATLHLADSDLALAQQLLPILERKAGRILVNGFPTGVEVSYAMVHGGPAPATSDSRVTSVGAMAIERFLRPVCYQNFPAPLLPASLADANPLHLSRLVDGKLQLP